MDAVVIIRWVFNFILTPAAVIGVFAVLITNVLRIVARGFDQDKLEGYQRVGVAVLPFAFFVYAVVSQHPSFSGGGTFSELR
ncbi:MAG TPA: hypothetical protein VNN21_00800, partial [Dehalococcoidia bacterium]|nr:hypothetical protein [Dehalococcoidia bacterium]